MILENLRTIKAKHTVLCSQVREITASQRDSMDSIRIKLKSVIKLIEHVQQTIDVEVPSQTVHSLFKNLLVALYCIQRRVLCEVFVRTAKMYTPAQHITHQQPNH